MVEYPHAVQLYVFLPVMLVLVCTPRGAPDTMVGAGAEAPAGVLTELKQKLAKPVVGCVVQDLQKDLTNVPDGDLTEHLAPR